MFKRSSTRSDLDRARAVLCGKRGPTTISSVPGSGEVNVEFTAEPTERLFNLDVAKTFLVFSALVYERIDSLVIQAAQVASADRSKAERLLVESEKVIRQQAEDWGLQFEVISDLASTSGPFASVFFTGPHTPEGERFIVCCFKGTTPSNYAEVSGYGCIHVFLRLNADQDMTSSSLSMLPSLAQPRVLSLVLVPGELTPGSTLISLLVKATVSGTCRDEHTTQQLTVLFCSSNCTLAEAHRQGT
jgi:hypothetical protein